MKPHLLIVEDDEDIRTQLKWGLGEDYEVATVEDRPSALKAFRELRPPAVLLDLGLPPHPASPAEGLAALGEILSVDRHAKVIISSGQSEKKSAMEAIGGGAYDFLCKPVDMDELKLILRRAQHVSQLERDYAAIQKRLDSDSFEGILGDSPSMESVFASIRKVANTEAPVLILGESGTGKEVVARAIHQRSLRKDGPFVAINCGAIPENLLESELFGHERGSFTGATAQRRGRIELASEGTLFLDEIGELPLPLQVKILRFLQDHCITRVGGREELSIDARVLAATNGDLKQMIQSNSFREDLYYRLAVVVMELPPLRDRGSDVALLANAFLQRFGAENNRSGLKFAAEAVRAMQAYEWPGNVRELENRVRRATIMADGKYITPGDLELDSFASSPLSLKEARDRLDRSLIEQALRRSGGKISGAAQVLGISRPTLYELMDKLQLRRGKQEETQ